MALATLSLLPDTRHGDSPRYEFLAAQFPDTGMPIDVGVDTEEELSSAGVDYLRWRTLRADYPAWTMVTWAEALDIEAARLLARKHWGTAGRLANLTLTWGTRQVSYRRVHISPGVIAQPRPGTPAGVGVSGASTATVQTTWILRCTEIGS